MKTNKIFIKLRKGSNLTQEQFAQKLFVTRQAVSRWENGETIPSIDTLNLMSKIFNISINSLLGNPIELYCQACGMPLSLDERIARNSDGSFNEKYCKWCIVDGNYVGPNTVEEMIEICVPYMKMPEDDARRFLQNQLLQLEHWINMKKS